MINHCTTWSFVLLKRYEYTGCRALGIRIRQISHAHVTTTTCDYKMSGRTAHGNGENKPDGFIAL